MTRLGVRWVSALTLAIVSISSVQAAYIRYEFVFNEFRESAGPFAPYEQMTGYVEADVNYTTGAFNSFIGGAISLTGGPSTTSVTGEQSFGEYHFYGPSLGKPIDSTGGILDFFFGLNITGGVTNPTLGSAGVAYSPPTYNQNFSYDIPNGSHSILVYTSPIPEPASLGLCGFAAAAFVLRRRRNRNG
ncbi:MAG: PEP-CTERM sorting domain-containing protein [Planctomycetales bacterium]|nr:PEP-CTERM sorting domain-containing protein [Planctomycetales bacterium]